MDKKNTTTIIYDEYATFIKSKETGKYLFCHPTLGRTYEEANECFAEYRKTWEACRPDLDFTDFKIRHRSIITTTTELEVVE